jgi:hypothetical protein
MASNERIGAALNSGNLRNDETHFDADLVAALAFVSKLGSQLQHVASGGYVSELQPAIDELARVIKKACSRRKMGISWSDANAAATQAMREWLIRICRSCNGSGERLVDYSGAGKPMRKGQCNHCNGTGIFIPTWKWRKEVMRLDAEASQEWWDKRIELGKEIAEDAYRAARKKVTFQVSEIF